MFSINTTISRGAGAMSVPSEGACWRWGGWALHPETGGRKGPSAFLQRPTRPSGPAALPGHL